MSAVHCATGLHCIRSAAGQCCGPNIVAPVHYTSKLFQIQKNKLIGYADDFALIAVVPSPGVRVTVGETLIHDDGRVSEWCDLLEMKLNASKTKTMLVSRSCTMHPKSPPLTTGGTLLKVSGDLVILGVTF